MPLKSLVGVPTTGLLLTLGEPDGVSTVISGWEWAKVPLTSKSKVLQEKLNDSDKFHFDDIFNYL